MRLTINGVNVMSEVVEIMWNGDIKGSARSVQVTGVKADAGDKVFLYNDLEQELFRGMVYAVGYDTNEDTNNFIAYDEAFRLNKNKLLKVFNGEFPSQIAKNVLSEIKVKIGEFPKDVEKCTFTAFDRSGYDIIMNAYKMQSLKNGKVYSIISEEDKISVIEEGTLIQDFSLEEKINIRTGNFTKSIEELVNQILIYKTEKEKFQIKGKRQDLESIAKYGIFQEVIQEDNYNKEMNGVNPNFKKPKESASLTVDGYEDLISGYSVAVKEPKTGLNGIFTIETDSHTWTSGEYVTTITLNFEEILTESDIFGRPESKKKKTKKGRGRKKISKDSPRISGGVEDWELRQ